MFRAALEDQLKRPVGKACMEKKRSAGVVSGDRLMGEVTASKVLILDDLIGTGTTIRRAVHACVDAGAAEVVAVAAHGLFLEGAAEVVADPALSRIVVTNTVPPLRLPTELAKSKVDVLDVSGLL